MTTPKRIGKYEIAEQIGVGGFGVVYKAWDPYIQRWVALKTCATTEDEANQRFFREAQLAGALQHPNITLIFDFGVEDGVPYFVQEFLTGTDLDELMAKRRLSLEGVLAVLIQVAAGLEFAHSRGIVHRDIKPANVRVLEDGTVKIMDFGIAKSLQAESRLTQTGVALGTAGYLAPEQLSGKPLDARTDIFSLGVMTYELVTGVRPFTGPSISNVIYQILHQTPLPPRQRNARCPERVEKIILKALAKNPDDRYPSVHEFGQDLKEALAALSTRTQARRVETTTALVRSELARLGHEPGESVTAAAELAAQPLEHIPAGPPETGGHRPRRRLVWLLALGLFVVAALVVAVLWPSITGSGTGPRASLATPAPALPTPAPTGPPTPVPTPTPVTASVELFADPVSEVSVDGRDLGRIQTARVDLTVGRHTIRQRIAGYMEKERTVDISASTTRINLQLPPYGLLSVVNDFGVAIQGAEVSIDGQRVGALPVREHKVEAGRHEVRVSWPDGRSFSRTVEVAAARTVPVVVRPE